MPQYPEMTRDLRATARDMAHADNKKIFRPLLTDAISWTTRMNELAPMPEVIKFGSFKTI